MVMEHQTVKRPQFFFTTAPMPCPYLPGRMERKIVTELNQPGADALHDVLSRAGFRRSHSIAYAPACSGCNACIPVRIVAPEFKMTRNQRKVWNANSHLTVTPAPPRATAEQYALFSRYQAERHTGSDMALMGFYDYRSMVDESPIDTCLMEFRDGSGELQAVCLTDRMSDGLSAVYSFFDPSLQKRSLGTHMILWLVEEARRRALPYVYLGYWIRESRKMAYKIRFQPLEGFTSQGWRRIDETFEPERPIIP